MQFQLKKNKRFGAIIVSVFLILLLAVMLSSELKSVRHFHYTELNLHNN